jgi:hypothetical protein
LATAPQSRSRRPGDQRGPWARRWRDLLGEIINDLGGADILSEGQKQLARRCATISIACERRAVRSL